MKTLDDFKKYYDQQLLQQLKPLEKKRKLLLVIFVAAVVIVTVLLLQWPIRAAVPQAVIFFGYMAFLISAFILYPYLVKRYAKTFKPVVIGDIVRFIDEQLKYKPDGFISAEELAQSGLFQSQDEKGYKGDDLVWGEIAGVQVRFSEVMTQAPRFWGKIVAPRVSFKGLFFIGQFNKDVKGRTFVLPDIWEKLLGRIGHNLQKLHSLRGDLVKLEDVEFEKAFAVYSTDQVEARYILSTSLMQRLLDFRRKAGRNVLMSFIGSRVYIAVPHQEDLFEPNLFKSLLNFDAVKGHFENLKLAVDIVEDLNLNTRIWTRQ
jgi:hypothetical protein